MLPQRCCSYRSPSKLRNMPKRRLTRTCVPSPVKSPSLDRFYKVTKDGKGLELSPKHLRSRRLSKKSSPDLRPKSPDIRRFLSPSSERASKKRVVPKRRVNLNSVFEHIVTVTEVPVFTISQVAIPASLPSDPPSSSTGHSSSADEPSSSSALKRSQPQAPSPEISQPPTKCIRTDHDVEVCVDHTRQVISLVSNKTELPPSDPSLPPPPCIKRTWKSAGPMGRPGVKLFDPNSPRTESKMQMLCKKLWFGSPGSCEIQTIS